MDFANRLKRAAVDCKFEGHRDRALREQLITGITVESIRKKLLTSPEKDIDTFVKTLEIASREEMAIRQTRGLTSSPNTHSTVPVHQLKECLDVLTLIILLLQLQNQKGIAPNLVVRETATAVVLLVIWQINAITRLQNVNSATRKDIWNECAWRNHVEAESL